MGAETFITQALGIASSATTHSVGPCRFRLVDGGSGGVRILPKSRTPVRGAHATGHRVRFHLSDVSVLLVK